MSVQQGTIPKKRSASHDRGILIVSFFLPFLLMGIIFALHGVFPFGQKQVMRHDFFYQYYPFIRELQTKMMEGSSPFWTWNIGMGMNFPALFFYYLASPLNLLIGLVPSAYLREAVTLFILIKVGLAGLFCAIMLKSLFRRSDYSLIFFSASYALCSFITGYFTNIMWLDSVALLPLVVLGTVRLLRERQFVLYTLTLALAIWCNFLIGLYICIFVVIVFVCLCVLDRVNLKEFLRRLARIALFSILAACMTAILALPTLRALGNGYRTINTFPQTNEWIDSFIDIIGNFAPMAEPTTIKGLPNVYTGLLVVLLLGSFVTVKKIRLAEKVLGLVVVAFLLVSGNSTQLYYIWNAFNITFSFPFRISFLLSFVLVVIGFRTLQKMERPSLTAILAMLVPGGIVALCAAIGPQTDRALWACVGFMAVYVAIMLLYRQKTLKRRDFLAVLLLVVAVELSLSAYVSLSAIDFPDRRLYPVQGEKVEKLLADVKAENPDDFYRIETDQEYGFPNETAMLNYRGISNFASTVNANVSRYVLGLGIDSLPEKNSYNYVESSPLAASLLNLRYYITRTANMADTQVYWQEMGAEVDVRLYENTAYLPLGFMVQEETLAYATDLGSRVRSQSDLFSRMTGLEGPLYTEAEVASVSGENLTLVDMGGGRAEYTTAGMAATPEEEATVTWTFIAPEDGMYYMEVDEANAPEIVITAQGRTFGQSLSRWYFHPLGRIEQGEEVTLVIRPPEHTQATTGITIYQMDQALFDSGIAKLGENGMTITGFTANEIEGTVDAAEAGVLYTSIPFEAGWRAFVDGEEVEITPLDQAVICIRLPEGSHAIRFTYVADGIVPGAIVTVVALAAFVACVAVNRHGRKRRAQADAQLVQS